MVVNDCYDFWILPSFIYFFLLRATRNYAMNHKSLSFKSNIIFLLQVSFDFYNLIQLFLYQNKNITAVDDQIYSLGQKVMPLDPRPSTAYNNSKRYSRNTLNSINYRITNEIENQYLQHIHFNTLVSFRYIITEHFENNNNLLLSYFAHLLSYLFAG